MTDAFTLTLIGAWFVTLPQMSGIRRYSVKLVAAVAAATFLWTGWLADGGTMLGSFALGCAIGLVFSLVLRVVLR